MSTGETTRSSFRQSLISSTPFPRGSGSFSSLFMKSAYLSIFAESDF
ncbi:hypothetical protein [Treponema porcinum]|nr:hypothetical protein [Treponema porcinum]MDD7126609.1 hypothetical protein [Treponema porcinum]MDY5453716.1 hypothetical protein [Treponema porcinum]